MHDLRIVIPSRGRADHQLTIRSLPESLLPQTCVVVPKEDLAAYKRLHGSKVDVIAQPKRIETIAQKRGWICKELCEEKLLMLDDDLVFQVRYDAKMRPAKAITPGVRLLQARGAAEVEAGFADLSDLLDKYVHGGFGSRLFNNGQPEALRHTTRCMHALAYTREACDIIKWGKVNLKEDFDAALQLLRKGYDNFLIQYVAVSPQGRYGAAGGCSEERAKTGHSQSAHELAAAHPEYVKVVTKNYKGIPRDEVVISWRKALADGRK